MKTVGMGAVTFAIIGVMVLVSPMEARAMWYEEEHVLIYHLLELKDDWQAMLDSGVTLVVVASDDSEIVRLEPGMSIDEVLKEMGLQPEQPCPLAYDAELELFSRVPEFAAPRDSTPSNGVLRDFLLEFIDMYIVAMQNENVGAHRGEMTLDSLIFSEYFLQGYRQAMAADTASSALGLNSEGMDVFYDSKTIDFFTRANSASSLGTFRGDDRLVSIAINTVRFDGFVAIEPEEIAVTIIYEIEGRGRGWEPMMNFAIVEHFGLPNNDLRRGLQFDPSLEVAVSGFAGGIHVLFEAADNGQDAVRELMNAHISEVNPYFDFDYDTWQKARKIDNVQRNFWHADQGTWAARRFVRWGGRIAEFQYLINAAIDPTTDPEIRKQSAKRVNEYVAKMAVLYAYLGDDWRQARLSFEYRFPVVDLANLDMGILGSVEHFPNMNERYLGTESCDDEYHMPWR